jgi:hypothetical protein
MNKLPWARFAAEFGVIVVGVLVALLAESAWQERGERSDEPEVLERISAELGLDSAIILDDTAEPQRGPRHPRERPVTAGPGVPSRRLAAESR